MQRKDRVGLEDVAREAGVSKSTVSRALRQESRVSAATVDHVRGVATRLGYVPDLRAAALASTHPSTLGLLIRRAERLFYGAIASQVQAETERLGMNLLMVGGGDSPESQYRAVENLLGHRVAGIIVASGRAASEVTAYAASFVPTVVVGLESDQRDIDSVCIDPSAEQQLAKAVARAGHRRVVVTTSDDPRSLTLRARSARFSQVLRDAGVTTLEVACSVDDSGSDAVHLRAAVESGATAVMAGDDPTAVWALECLDAWGLRCPQDVSVTGYDGVGVYTTPLFGLTTVRQPVEALSEAAASIVTARIAGHVHTPDHRLIAGEFVDGKTLGPPPA